MKTLKYIWTLILISACIDEVPYASDNLQPNALVVHSFINPDSAIKFDIARVSNISEPYKWISDAQVSLKRKSGVENFFNFKSDGQYVGNVTVVPNDSLKIKIGHALFNGEILVKVPSKVKITRVDTMSMLVGSVGKTKAFKIHFKDSAYNKNYYRIFGIKTFKKYIFNGLGQKVDSTFINERMSIGSSDIQITRNIYNTYTTKELLFSDEISNGIFNRILIYETYNRQSVKDIVLYKTEIYLENISEEMYVYLNSRNAHIWQQSSITQLPTQVLGNLKSAFGVIGTYTSDKYIISN